ncbi:MULTISPECIES: PASTA domain-containing protein [Dokdonia]|jgi:beta-lactam-binding protein with PASTA domain|uniref:Serine/threonine protein kinase n=2 Tax=Dokdonia TaxID=326319 RepID=A0A0A2H4Q5_9FLAO|nr:MULTISPECIES: PASTA domain-containing protein [Dokdonia]ANH60344.1 PASTA domain protein [Dokdonia donghaensis DSW-1]EAQ37718.1 serine/threonine protein kinase [Dokdonia sp. MED134]KGO07625.1 serine/threonine protein kinase [Dokdonia donghaensis DSW-1]MDE0597926.1 PASTA domain-containing protein [Dokdonia donghaensis]
MSFVKFLVSKAFVKQIALAIIIVIALIFITRWWLGSTTNHDERIAVPNVKGMTLDLVSQELENAELRYFIIDSANFNPDYPKYSVIDQEPNAGKFVKENRQIYLVLNPSGYQKMTIPPIVGKTRRQAEPTLKALGFKIGKITYVDWIGEDEVRDLRHKGKKVKAGDRLEKTSVIDLVLGNGKGDYRDAISNNASDDN